MHLMRRRFAPQRGFGPGITVSTKRAIIELSPTRLQVTVVRGTALVACVSTRLEAESAEFASARLAPALVASLRALVEAAGARGLESVLIYHAASANSGVFSCATSAGVASAMEAAELALAESAMSSLLTAPSDLEVLAFDRPVTLSGAATEEAPQTHVLGVVDDDASVGVLHAMLTEAGLRPVGMIPAPAVGFADSVHAAIESSLLHADALCLSLHLGEQGSVLAGAARGRLRFVRQLSPGVESFVDALVSGADQTQLTGGAFEAAELLAAVGIPHRDQRLANFGGITGQSVLPLLQSVLQRLGVEIKQSLRFGVETHERSTVVLAVVGAGSGVPNLGEVVAEQCGATLLASGTQAFPEVHGETRTYLGGGVPAIGLMPREHAERVGGVRLRHALWVGAAATSLLIGFDAWSSSLDLRLEQGNILSLKSRLEGAKGASELFARLTATQSALAQAREARDARFTSNLDAVGVLAMLSIHTPDAVKLSHVQVMGGGDGSSVRIAGRAVAIAGVDPDTALRSFVESLSSVPLVRTCRMGATRRGADADGAMIQTFELTLSLVDLPSSFALGGIAAGEDER